MSKEVSFKRTRVGAIVCAVLMLAVLVLSAVGLVLCLIKPTMPVSPVLVMGSGLSGLVGCLGMKAFQLGSTWAVLLILFIAALVMGGLTLYWRIKQQ